MEVPKLEMKFDPQTVRHLGVKMYSQLPAALSEIISNSYDAFATEVYIELHQKGGVPDYISVNDNGVGLTFEEIDSKFLVIGRNRRDDEKPEDRPFKRAPTGKKGLGKLALFGLAKVIEIETVKGGLKNKFLLDYDALLASTNRYEPQVLIHNEPTDLESGTTVTLRQLKRTSPFDVDGVMNSLSRIFMLDADFRIFVSGPGCDLEEIEPNRKYGTIEIEFSWDLVESGLLKEATGNLASISGVLYTAKKPIPPSSGLRGVTLYSRGKLVNAPEYFSESTSSHFYSYLTGWIAVDFVDELDDDLISTNRQSLVWDDPRMEALRIFLQSIISKVNSEWREKRKEKKNNELKEKFGVDTAKWYSTLPDKIAGATKIIVDTVSSDESFDDSQKVVEALYKIVPEYAELHWRHLNEAIQEPVQKYYKSELFGDAAAEAVKLYFDRLKEMTGWDLDGSDMVNHAYRSKDYTGDNSPKIRLNKLITDSEKSIQEGQSWMSKGVFTGFRNPISHSAMSKMVPDIFTDTECLNILSLVSYLMSKLDKAEIDETAPPPKKKS